MLGLELFGEGALLKICHRELLLGPACCLSHGPRLYM